MPSYPGVWGRAPSEVVVKKEETTFFLMVSSAVLIRRLPTIPCSAASPHSNSVSSVNGYYFMSFGVMLLHWSILMKWQLAVNLFNSAAVRCWFFKNFSQSSKPRFEVMIVDFFLPLISLNNNPAWAGLSTST